jgi:hypothetical protein
VRSKVAGSPPTACNAALIEPALALGGGRLGRWAAVPSRERDAAGNMRTVPGVGPEELHLAAGSIVGDLLDNRAGPANNACRERGR